MKAHCRWTLSSLVLMVVLFAGGLRHTVAQQGNGEKTFPQQTLDSITVKFHGARYDAKRQRLGVRVEVWGQGLETADFGTPVIVVDGERKQRTSTSMTVGTGKAEPG